MRSDKTDFASTLTTRQKVTAGIFLLVVIILLWQLVGLFRGGNPPPASTTANKAVSMQQQPMQPVAPQVATGLPKPKALSAREQELIQMQQETQAKYLAALNELQMLKVSREIAETNQAIMIARLATVTAQKNIVNLLAPPPVAQGAYAKGLVAPATAAAGNTQASPQAQPEVNYTVISVSQLQYRWGAVLGYQGNLYSVSIGDVLPADGSKVVAIDKSGVTLEKNSILKKISLVPII